MPALLERLMVVGINNKQIDDIKNNRVVKQIVKEVTVIFAVKHTHVGLPEND